MINQKNSVAFSSICNLKNYFFIFVPKQEGNYIYSSRMFLPIIITLLVFTVATEAYIFCHHIRHRSNLFRIGYIAIAALSIAPYFTLMIVGRIIDLHSTASSLMGAIGIVLFTLNFICKICWCCALLLKPRRWATYAFATIATIGCMLIIYGTLWERFNLRTTHIELAYQNLPDEADGLRIAQISDLHIGRLPRRHTILRRLAAEIAYQRPDIVIDCGDMINGRYEELDSLSMEILSSIVAPLGTYTTLGNHDLGHYILDSVALPAEENIRLLIERQAAMGWHNLAGSTAPLIIGGDTLYLTALDYPKKLKKGSHGKATDEDYSPLFESIPSEAFNIVVAHTPVVWPNILSATEAELTLAGHVHAMQIKLPFVCGGRGWSPAALAYTHWSGLYREGNCAFHISDGIGGSIPIRIGVRPQLVVITLRKS